MIGTQKADENRPQIDATVANILVGYNWLSDQREVAVGMSGGLPQPIPITEMVSYYEVFKPMTGIKHFTRVVRAADMEFLKLKSEKMQQKTAKNGQQNTPSPSGSVFPQAPTG